jgi:hypothetical protein
MAASMWHFRAYFFRQVVLVTISIQSGYLVAYASRPGRLTLALFQAKVAEDEGVKMARHPARKRNGV